MILHPCGYFWITLGIPFVSKNRLGRQRYTKWRQHQNKVTLLESILVHFFQPLSFFRAASREPPKELEQDGFLERVKPRKLSPRPGKSTICKFKISSEKAEFWGSFGTSFCSPWCYLTKTCASKTFLKRGPCQSQIKDYSLVRRIPEKQPLSRIVRTSNNCSDTC